jgi:predicted O-methyltransferase YrrM
MITTTDHEKHQIVNYIRAIGALRVLEIGAFQGETTSVIASAVAEVGGRVVVIDPMKWSSEVLRNGIARHLSTTFPRILGTLERILDRASYEPAFWRKVGGRERTDIVVYRALSTDPGLLANTDEALAEFDVVFIDGDHGYEGARSDLEHWGRRVRKGGIILVHDATSRFPGVLRAIREWNTDPAVEVILPEHDSLCVIHVRGELRSDRAPAVASPAPRPNEFLAAAIGK